MLDEQLHQVLRQPDLLGQRVVGQVEQPLERGLDLDHQHAEEGARELHAAEGLAEALLLRRERLDRVAELLGRGDGLEHQRDLEVVLVLHDDRRRRLEHVSRGDPSHEQHERAELTRLGLELQRCDLQLQVLVGLDITQEALKPVFDLIENGLDQVLDQITIDTRSCCGMLCFKSPTQATKTDQALRKANRDIEPLLHELQQQVADGLETIALELKEVESIADELKSSSPEPSPGIANTLKEMNEIQIEFGKDSNAEHDDVEENSETPMLSGEVESPDDNTGETDRWAKISLIVSKKMKVKHIIAAVNACLANADGIDMQIESLVPLWTRDYSAFNTDKKIIKLLKHSVNLSGEEYDARQEDPVKLVGIDHEQFNAEVWSQHLDFSGAEFVTYTADFGEVSDDSDSDSDDDDLELHIGLRLQM